MTTSRREPNRRDFLTIATTATGAVGAGAAAWPFVDQMNPSGAALADATLEVDIGTIKEGMQAVFRWRGHPLVVRRRTKQEIHAARTVTMSDLLDPLARNANLSEDAPATDANRALRPEWLVVVGICTHLGCTPTPSTPQIPAGAYGGWLCRCHGSQFDTAGRVRTGPATQNLIVPPYAFLADNRIRIG